MSIEVRNFYPSGDATNISIYSDIEFDLVGLDEYTIDITSLTIEVTTSSNVDDDDHVTTYAYDNSRVLYSGDSGYYKIVLNPAIPFDLDMEVTIKVNVEGLDELSVYAIMEEYESAFDTVGSNIVSDFRYAFIDHAQNIPIYQEQLRRRISGAPQAFDSAFGSWNRSPSPKVQVNQLLVSETDATYGHSIDYENGIINFDSALDYNDMVEASYYFSFFNEEQINGFFKQASAVWNFSPPSGGPRDIYAAGIIYRGVLMVGAAMYAFRSLMMSLAFQETRIIFDDASSGQGWTQIKDLFKSLYDSYKEDWDKLLEAKKVKLPQISTIITPSYTMPGGRTLSSLDLCELSGGQFVNFNTMFNMIDEGLHVDVLSNNKGNLYFSRVSCIEYEGRKDVFGVGISTGEGRNLIKHQINTSLDHKYETPSGMKRLKDLNINDSVLINQDGKIIKGKIEEVGYNGFLDCYEIQVPETEKFFCNSVSVSNSRMFRYMYKGGNG